MSRKIAIPAVLLALLLIALPMAQTQAGLPVPTPSVNDAFLVSWPAIPDIGGYNMQYRMGTMDWTNMQLTFQFATSSNFGTSPEGYSKPPGDYQVRVRTFKGSSVSAWSKPVSFTIPAPKLPGTDNISHNGFIITWDAVPNAVGYKISVKGIRPRRIAGSWVDVTTNSYTIPNGQYGQMYAVLVQTVGDGVNYAADSWFNTNPYFMTPQAPPPTATSTPTNTPTPTDAPTETNTPIPAPGPVRSLKSTGVLTDAFSVDWKPPLVGVSRKTTYRVEYMDPWSDSWSLAGTTDRLSYYKNEAGWSGEFGIRVRAEGKNGVGPWSRISASVA